MKLKNLLLELKEEIYACNFHGGDYGSNEEEIGTAIQSLNSILYYLRKDK